MTDVPLPEALGQQHLDILSEQLLSRVAEEADSLTIGTLNAPITAHQEDRVRYGLEQSHRVWQAGPGQAVVLGRRGG
jgi:hypothetical protein